jgi:hypothetical protein
MSEALKAIIPPGMSPRLRWSLAISGWLLGLTIFAAWSLGWIGVPGFARAENQGVLEHRVQSVERAITLADKRRERDALTAWSSELGRDVFSLEREIDAMEKAKQQVPERYLRQLNQMRSDKVGAERRLTILMQTHPELLTVQ